MLLAGMGMPENRRIKRSRILRAPQLGIDAGRFQAEDTDLIAQTLWSAAHGITSLLIQRPGFPWVNRKRLIQQVIDGAVQQFRVTR